MIRRFRRRRAVPSFADLAAEMRTARAEQAKRAQDAAWATYTSNILCVGFVR